MNIKERNFLGLSDSPENKNNNFNLKATELSLGLPGSQSPDQNPDFSLVDERQLFPLLPSKDCVCSSQKTVIVSGNKRGFFHNKFNGYNTNNKNNGSNTDNKSNGSNTNSAAPASKAQVVGWPPIRSFRKNTLAMISKNNEEVDGKPGPSALFVKVSMDGAPYLRKVDLRSYADYQELSSALEKMFSCFTIGQCGPEGNPTREMISESKLRDLIHGSEYVLTYEDKDSDWMLVGDVPWEMFIASCKKLKIMKGSDAIGLSYEGHGEIQELELESVEGEQKLVKEP